MFGIVSTRNCLKVVCLCVYVHVHVHVCIIKYSIDKQKGKRAPRLSRAAPAGEGLIDHRWVLIVPRMRANGSAWVLPAGRSCG